MQQSRAQWPSSLHVWRLPLRLFFLLPPPSCGCREFFSEFSLCPSTVFVSWLTKLSHCVPAGSCHDLCKVRVGLGASPTEELGYVKRSNGPLTQLLSVSHLQLHPRRRLEIARRMQSARRRSQRESHDRLTGTLSSSSISMALKSRQGYEDELCLYFHDIAIPRAFAPAQPY